MNIYLRAKGKESQDYADTLSSIGLIHKKLCSLVPASSLSSKSKKIKKSQK